MSAPPSQPGLVTTLSGQLPTFMPAHETLVWTRAGAADLIHVQGRGDRLHSFLVAADDGDLERADSAAEVPSNWFWFVVPLSIGPAWLATVEREADRVNAGILTLAGLRLTRHREAPARPGIFIARHAELRAEWRKLSSW